MSFEFYSTLTIIVPIDNLLHLDHTFICFITPLPNRKEGFMTCHILGTGAQIITTAGCIRVNPNNPGRCGVLGFVVHELLVERICDVTVNTALKKGTLSFEAIYTHLTALHPVHFGWEMLLSWAGSEVGTRIAGEGSIVVPAILNYGGSYLADLTSCYVENPFNLVWNSSQVGDEF